MASIYRIAPETQVEKLPFLCEWFGHSYNYRYYLFNIKTEKASYFCKRCNDEILISRNIVVEFGLY